METNDITKTTENVEINDLYPDFYSLRIGEEIPRLEIKQIRKITNSENTNNLAGVDFKYYIYSTENKILSVNSWVLWNAIVKALKTTDSIKQTLSLKHLDQKQYEVKVIS